MDRLPLGILLTAASAVSCWRQAALWRRRGQAGSVREEVLARAVAPLLVACSALTAVVGLLLALHALAGTGTGPVALVLAVLAVVLVGGLVAVAAQAVHVRARWRVRAALCTEQARSAALAGPPPAPAGWVPPTPQAAALLEAGRSGDVEAACAALASRGLYFLVAAVDDVPDGPRLPRGATLPDGRFQVVAHTEGCVPPPPAQQVLRRAWADLELARLDPATLLLVDGGHPHQTRIDAATLVRRRSRHPRTAEEERPTRVRAVQPVDTRGDLVHGLACTAWHAALNDDPWNVLGPRGRGRLAHRTGLQEGWGVEDARGWQQMLDRLADPEPMGGDLIFGLRRDVGGGAFVPAEAAAGVIEANADRHGREATDGFLAELRRIEAYEGYMRDQGVIGRGEQVHSLLAWDLGRGAVMARNGLHADFCDEGTARWQVERFGALVRRCYDSWPEFGAALVLGRLLWTAWMHDEDSDWDLIGAEDCIRPFTVLMSEPTSPWRTVPFHPAPAPTPTTEPSAPESA